MNKFFQPNRFRYRFILGAGVNFEYGMPSWEATKRQFQNVIDGPFGSQMAETIQKEVFNTTYGFFQVVKDIDRAAYERLLRDAVKPKAMPNIADSTTLNAVASVLTAQVASGMYHQSVLTFNYDNLLEQSLVHRYLRPPNSVYKGSRKHSGVNSINIIHSHGFLPSDPRPRRHWNSIVLTATEYFENYKHPGSYGYKTLYEQLSETCSFVDNSLTDYEEQKVISAHFNRSPSRFHFWFGAYGQEFTPAHFYKTIFLLKRGVIPLWYSSHTEYAEEFFEYTENLAGIKSTQHKRRNRTN